MQKPLRRKKRDIGGIVLTVLFSLVCILYVMPIVEVLINSFKTHSAINTDTFALPNADTFAGTSNYVKGMTFGNYPFLKSLLYSIVITILSVTLILLCTSMAAWFISRVGGRFSRLFYLGCVFSMIVPFQMVMFPLVSVANDLYLNTPWTIPVIYLGFGAGLAVFMFSGFVKSLPLEIEEAAVIDGCARSARSSASSCPCCARRSSPSAFSRSCGCGTTTSCPPSCSTSTNTRPFPSMCSICRAAMARPTSAQRWPS